VKDNPFNYVAAVAAAVSMVLAFMPYLPRHRRYIRYAAIFFLGMLVGSLCASLFTHATTVFQLGIPWIWLLGAAVVAVIVIGVILLLVSG
jgi:MFS family permease